jgi:hypothetical protein
MVPYRTWQIAWAANAHQVNHSDDATKRRLASAGADFILLFFGKLIPANSVGTRVDAQQDRAFGFPIPIS